MEKPSPENKPQLPIWTATIVVGLIIIAAIIFLLRSQNTETPAKAWFNDPENDVILNVGTGYPGMIDVTNAKLEENENVLKITINVSEAIIDLGEGEYAQWDTTIILQNGLPKAYEVYAEMNSTQLISYVMEIGGQKAETCTVQRYTDSLILLASINELQNTNEIQWYILTTFEKWSEHELIINGSDIAPDEGIQTTILAR